MQENFIENESAVFQKNLKALRKAHNYTVRDFGSMLGVTHVSVLQWENGKNEPRLGMLRKIARVFNVPISQLIELDIASILNEKGALPPLPKIELGSGGDPQPPTPPQQQPPPPQAQEQAYDRERIEKMIDEGLERGLEKVLGKIIMAGISASK